MISLSDAELLHRYAREGSNAAFETLVRRHIDVVYAIALRQVGGDAHLAKDVTQLVFAAVARKASFLSERAVLGGWLCRTTQYTARDAIRAEQRRRTREKNAQAMEPTSNDAPSETDLTELRRHLDETMSDLSDADRDAVWLRFFDERSFAQVGAKLYLTENAARMRVDRALDKMRLRLRRRGITSTALVLSELLAEHAAGSAPAGLASVISGSVFAGDSAAQASSFIHFMTSNKLAVLITSGLAAAGAVGFLGQYHANGQLRAEDAALRKQLSELSSSQAENRQIKRALKESDQELGSLLNAIAHISQSSESTAVPQSLPDPRVTIIGAVGHPGTVPVGGNQGITLTDALSLVGGLTGIADRRVVVNHRDDDGTIDKQTIDVRGIANGKIVSPKLQANDIVVVFERTR